ncbi:MAG: imidazole glycerol phosphate synthase subunit HisH [Lachnospiraceae bacterium]|nr:imidazole glycerol phosphate synthase subunit HisH [Lachnospiraceae bacterium]
MIAIIDYDAGNLKSVEKALASLGEESVITRDRREILRADKVVLPGVGAFGDAMGKLHQYGLASVIREVADGGTPFLGICLGLQLLFESSEESPGVEGLGICKGQILRIPRGYALCEADTHLAGSSVEAGALPDGASVSEQARHEDLKIPHMGWNSLKFDHPGRLFAGIPEESYVYFVHSYYLKAANPEIVTASTFYSVNIHASIEQGNVFACQFHPEKSSRVGIAILKNFIDL